MNFADQYGPWALVAGASDGVGAAFAEALAGRGLNVVLLARRSGVLGEVAAGIRDRTGVLTRCLVIDLTDDNAASAITEATADLDIGFLVYCAGSDPRFEPFLDNPVEISEAMVWRNCITLMRLCHHYAASMAARGRGGIVVFGSGAGLAGAPNLVSYSATKAFDMVFAEALWCELHDKGLDILGLILGKTDTPALRQLKYERGAITTLDQPLFDVTAPAEVVCDALDNLTNGPTYFVGNDLRSAEPFMRSMSRNELVNMIARTSALVMDNP